MLFEVRPFLGSIAVGVPNKEPSSNSGVWPLQTVLGGFAAAQAALGAADWTRPDLAREAVADALMAASEKPRSVESIQEPLSAGDSPLTPAKTPIPYLTREDRKRALHAQERDVDARNVVALTGDEMHPYKLKMYLAGASMEGATADAPQDAVGRTAGSWEALLAEARLFAWRLPETANFENPRPIGADTPSGTLESERLEEKLGVFARRFGFGVVRLCGFHEPEEAWLVIERFSQACETLAQATGLAEREIGLDGVNLALGSPFLGHGSAFHSRSKHFVCCSAKSGWGAWAHEWLHGLDACLAQRLLSDKAARQTMHISRADSSWVHAASPRIGKAFDALTHAMQKGATPYAQKRPGAPSNDIAAYAEDAGDVQPSGLPLSFIAAAIDRVEKGIFDIFLSPRLLPGEKDTARAEFRSLFGEFFSKKDAADTEERINAWHGRRFNSQTNTYLQIALSEKELAKWQYDHFQEKRPLENSAFVYFATLVDRRMKQEYAASAEELWARSFEAVIHGKTSDQTMAFLSGAGPNSGGLYPRANERNHIREAWGGFFSALRDEQSLLGLKFDKAPDFELYASEKDISETNLTQFVPKMKPREKNKNLTQTPSAISGIKAKEKNKDSTPASPSAFARL